jgi:hypothetical protein
VLDDDDADDEEELGGVARAAVGPEEFRVGVVEVEEKKKKERGERRRRRRRQSTKANFFSFFSRVTRELVSAPIGPISILELPRVCLLSAVKERHREKSCESAGRRDAVEEEDGKGDECNGDGNDSAIDRRCSGRAATAPGRRRIPIAISKSREQGRLLLSDPRAAAAGAPRPQ